MSSARWGLCLCGSIWSAASKQPWGLRPFSDAVGEGAGPVTEGGVLPSQSPRLPCREMLPVCVQS